MPVRVVRIMHRLSISGPTHHAAYLTRYLKSPFETTLLSGMLSPGEVDGRFILDALQIEPRYIRTMKRSINPFQDLWATWEIYRLLRNIKPHIVHTHAAKSGTLGRLAAMLAGVPIIIHTFHGHTFHSYFHPWITRVFIWLERFLASRSTCIIAISQLQKEELCNQFNICAPEKMKVIPLGFDLEKFRTDADKKRQKFRTTWKLAEDELAIGIAGRLTAIKDHALFLHAFARVKKDCTEKIKALLIGDGELKESLQQQCRELGLHFTEGSEADAKADVIFTSWQEGMDEVMNGLDIVALSSRNEGTPVTLIEAMAAGKPIVSTRVGGIADIVAEGKQAFLSASGDTEAFAANLITLITQPDLRKQMTRHSGDVYERFDFKRLVQDIQQLYERLLQEKQIEAI